MRTLLHTILQALVDAEAAEHIGAGLLERKDTRTTQRNASRTKVVSTTPGDLSVKIAKTRTGSFFPTLLHVTPGFTSSGLHELGSADGLAPAPGESG